MAKEQQGDEEYPDDFTEKDKANARRLALMLQRTAREKGIEAARAVLKQAAVEAGLDPSDWKLNGK